MLNRNRESRTGAIPAEVLLRKDKNRARREKERRFYELRDKARLAKLPEVCEECGGTRDDVYWYLVESGKEFEGERIRKMYYGMNGVPKRICGDCLTMAVKNGQRFKQLPGDWDPNAGGKAGQGDAVEQELVPRRSVVKFY